MRLSGSTKVHDLLTAYPFLEDFLASRTPKLEMLRNRMARATIGRVATLRAAAGIADLDLDSLLQALATEIERRTGTNPGLEASDDDARATRAQRIEALKGIISELHAGGDLDKARERFAAVVGDVEAAEIAAMEEELIRGGLPVSEVQRLCDVHVGAFRQALDAHPEVDVPPGHPVHTYLAANQKVTRLANTLGDVAREVEAGREVGANLSTAKGVLRELGGLENHYQRKENQLFPLLERHDMTGPSKVMWGVHDQIRAALRAARDAVEQADAEGFSARAPALARDIIEMVYKEEKILFPMAMQTLSDQEWAEVRRGEDELGYVLATPAAPWPAGGVAVTEGGAAPAQGLFALTTGELSPDQVNLILTHLPLDLSFVDENDIVRFYSEGPARIFPRSPAVIGRKVQNCHPPTSVHIVQEILDSFRAGTQHVAEFWMSQHGTYIHIRYFAVRNKAGEYRGCLEVTQDVTRIRQLHGERRLLAWAGGSGS